MKIEEACKHIGKEVVLDESTEPYKGPLKETHDFGLNVYGIIEDVNHDYVKVKLKVGNRINIMPHHLKLKQPNYKIRVTPETSAEVQELLFELGCAWASGQVNSQHTTMPYLYMYSKIITHGDDGSHFNKLGNQEITLPELRDMVVLKRNDVDDATHKDDNNYLYYEDAQGDKYKFYENHWSKLFPHEYRTTFYCLKKNVNEQPQITWQDALRAVADGKEIQVWGIDDWVNINQHYEWSLYHFSQRKFRIKPQTVTLEARPYTKEELLKIAGETE